jgi:hypothetical protein
VPDSAYAYLDESLCEVLTVGRPIERGGTGVSSGPAGNLDQAELQCLSYSQQRVRLCHLDQVCDCPALGLRLRQDPFSPQVVAPRVGLVSPVSILPRAEPPC